MPNYNADLVYLFLNVTSLRITINKCKIPKICYLLQNFVRYV